MEGVGSLERRHFQTIVRASVKKSVSVFTIVKTSSLHLLSVVSCCVPSMFPDSQTGDKKHSQD